MPPPSIEFDTKQLNLAVDGDRHFQIGAYLFVLAIVLLLSAALLARNWRTLASPATLWYDVAVWSMCALVAALIMDTLTTLRSGAWSVRLADRDVVLVYPGGRVQRVQWTAPSTDIRLLEWPNLPRLGYALRIGRNCTYISLEARDTILRRAEELRMRVETYTPFALNSALLSRVTRIRAGPSQSGTPSLGDGSAVGGA